MAPSESTVRKFVAVSTLVLGGFAVWLWTRHRRRQRALAELEYLKKSVVHIVTTREQWENCAPRLLQDAEKSKILGVDCEWVLRHRVALLQIASHSHYCVLVRLCNMNISDIPLSLKTLLSDKSILKLGVAINDDAKKLMRDYGLHMKGCVDLRHVLQRVRGIFMCRSWGLQGLAKCVLNFDLSKDFTVRCGNWEAAHLNQRQIDYGAMDAIVAVDIFKNLVLAKVTGLNPRLHQEAASAVTMDKFLSTTRSVSQGIVDVGYVRKTNPNKLTPRSTRVKDTDQLKLGSYSTRKRPLWDNCELLAPDGQPLCTCDKRKANWYINKSLGDKVSDDPLVVKLRFEPSGRPKSERNYYLQIKDNMCVVCGSTDSYARKFVVPQEYRKFFPSLLKEHTSHDVLLMCPKCHSLSSDSDVSLRLQLAQECNAPLNAGEHSSVVHDYDLQQVKSAGRALKLNRDKIPAARIQQLEKVLFDFYGVPEITPDVVETAANLDIKQTKDNYISHGQRVVEYIAQNGSLVAFQARWRRHFVDAMNPKFLPAFWSVDYVPENWEIELSDEEERSEQDHGRGGEEEDEDEEEDERDEEDEDEDIEFEDDEGEDETGNDGDEDGR